MPSFNAPSARVALIHVQPKGLSGIKDCIEIIVILQVVGTNIFRKFVLSLCHDGTSHYGYDSEWDTYTAPNTPEPHCRPK